MTILFCIINSHCTSIVADLLGLAAGMVFILIIRLIA